MSFDVKDLRDFYASGLGLLVKRRLRAHIRSHWQSRKISSLVGLGFASPYLSAAKRTQRTSALMPDRQGALIWPNAGKTRTALVRDDQLPLCDNSVDQFIVAHGLEVCERPRPMLREIWRVLSPEGRVLIIVPNRRGVWCRLDHTPFGYGSPFSRNQLENLLNDAMLTPEHWSSALHFPPVDHKVALRAAPAIERIAAPIGATFAGVLIVEARKELIAPAGRAKSAQKLADFVTVRRQQSPRVVPDKKRPAQRAAQKHEPATGGVKSGGSS